MNRIANKLCSRRRKKPLPETCIFCGRVFSTRFNLRLHLYQHIGEEPFFCRYCAATFRHSWSKRNHENHVHLGIKSKCSKCEASFNNKFGLRKHMKSKHADATAAEGPGPVASTLDTCDDPAYEKVWTFGPSPQLIIVKKTFENEEATKNGEDENKMKQMPQPITLPVTEEDEDAVAEVIEGPATPVASTSSICDPPYQTILPFEPYPEPEQLILKTSENECLTKVPPPPLRPFGLPLTEALSMTLPVAEENGDATVTTAAEVIEGPATPVASTSNTCDPSYETILPFDPYPEQRILKKPFENEDPTNKVKEPLPQPPPLRLFGLPLSGPWKPYTLPVREEVKKDKWDSSFFLHMNRYNLEEAESCSSRNVEEAQVLKEPPKSWKVKSRKEGGKLVGVSKVKRRQSKRLLVKAAIVGGRQTEYKE